MTSPTYAWCFSHGRMHSFDTTTDPPWCTAEWIEVEGATVQEAHQCKRARYGDAVFLHQLPLEEQAKIYEARGG